jgi:hypothetical protein
MLSACSAVEQRSGLGAEIEGHGYCLSLLFGFNIYEELADCEGSRCDA